MLLADEQFLKAMDDQFNVQLVSATMFEISTLLSTNDRFLSRNENSSLRKNIFACFDKSYECSI